MKPTVGRIVHFYDHTRPRDASGTQGPFAAIVTAVQYDEVVTLTIFPPGYPPVSVENVQNQNGIYTGVYWAWPPREGAES